MIWIIFRRELLDYMKSARFMIGLVVTLALVVTSTIVNTNDFQQRRLDYSAAQQVMQSDGFYIKVFRPPEVLSILVQGKDRILGNAIMFTFMDIPLKTAGYMGEGTSQHHRNVAGFSSIDFAFIIRVIMSLMVIFLGHNAISQEKVLGTMRLIFSNPVPRHVLLIGKTIAGLGIVLFVMLMAAIVSLVIIVAHPSISLSMSDWARIVALIAVSGLYLSCFFMLSLIVSSLVNRPSIALTILLQLWLFLVVIYPVVSIVAADALYPLPTEKQILMQKELAWQPFEREFKTVNEEFMKIFQTAQQMPPELYQKHMKLDVKRAEIHSRVDGEFSVRLSGQMHLAQRLSLPSPACLYDQIATRYSRTSIEQFEQFMSGVHRLWKAHVERMTLRWTDLDQYKRTTLPPFSFTPDSFTKGVIQTAPQLIALFLLCIMLFLLAFMHFLRKDVR